MSDNSATAIVDLAHLRSVEDKVSEIFRSAGFTQIEPAIMQPADIYLQQIGEAIRGRTYVFTDIDGEELCLRPDLTVPTARVYLERSKEEGERAKYFYMGPAFRYPSAEYTAENSDGANTREFRQAGIEIYGREEPEKTEADTLKLTLDALGSVGEQDFKIRLGDLGLFYALIDAIQMPDRWRKRLAQNFWRREEFQKILENLRDPANTELERDLRHLLRKLTDTTRKEAESQVADYLSERAIPLIGARTLTEITTALLEQAADLTADPLEHKKIELINRYLEISAPPKAVGARLEDLSETAGLDISGALGRYQKRIDHLSKADVDLSNAEFTAEFGRNIEYYTGFVFQIEHADMGVDGHIAGGGRYDNLVKSLGAEKDMPAIGAAIHLERLAKLVEGEDLS